jgi:hypothetical protein
MQKILQKLKIDIKKNENVEEEEPTIEEITDQLKVRFAEEIETGEYNVDGRDVENLQDKDFMRFLTSKDFNVEMALKNLLESLVWRNESGVKYVTAYHVKEEILKNKINIFGYDKEDRLVACVRVRYHIPAESDKRQAEKLLLFFAERAKSFLKPENETCTLIFDLTDFNISNMDYDIIKYMVRIFTDYYPETLGQLLVVNSPLIFKGIWRIVRPLLDAKTAKKIQFLSSPKLINYIDESILPPDLGGTNTNIINYGLGEDIDLERIHSLSFDNITSEEQP